MSEEYYKEVEKYKKELSNPNLSEVYIINSCSNLTDALDDPFIEEFYLKRTTLFFIFSCQKHLTLSLKRCKKYFTLDVKNFLHLDAKNETMM